MVFKKRRIHKKLQQELLRKKQFIALLEFDIYKLNMLVNDFKGPFKSDIEMGSYEFNKFYDTLIQSIRYLVNTRYYEMTKTDLNEVNK